MKLIIYAVKDTVACDFPITFEAPNEGMMKRLVKGSLLVKEHNVLNTDIKEKDIYEVGERDTTTGVIKGIEPLFIVHVSELRLELIRDIKIAKAEAGEKEPTADEVASDE